jgi:hypothetical protein
MHIAKNAPVLLCRFRRWLGYVISAILMLMMVGTSCERRAKRGLRGRHFRTTILNRTTILLFVLLSDFF